MSLLSFFQNNHDVIGFVVWPFVDLIDIVSLSMSSKDFEIICIQINRSTKQSVVVQEYGSYRNRKTTISHRVSSIGRMIQFSNITKLKFDCLSRQKIACLTPFFGPGLNSYRSCYCEYYNADELSIIFNSYSLQNSLLELSLPIRSDHEIKGIGLLHELQRLELFYSLISSDAFCNEIKLLTNLTSITLHYCLFLTVDVLYYLTHSNISHALTELNVTYSHLMMTEFSNCFRDNNLCSLKYLNIEGTIMPGDAINEMSSICLLKTLTSLNLNYCLIGNIAIDCLSNLNQLKQLYLRHTNVSQTSFLSCLTNLRLLDCRGCKEITRNDGLRNLSYLSDLEILNIGYCNITNTSSGDNLPCLSKLEKLNLSGYDGSPYNLVEIGDKFKGLTSLTLMNCTLPDKVFIVLRKLPSLVFLDISNRYRRTAAINNQNMHPPCSDLPIMFIASLKNLTSLVANKAFDKITDEGLLLLSTMTNLSRLELDDHIISAIGISRHFSKLSRLSILSLSGCELIDESDHHAINNFSIIFPSLTNLNISRSHNICLTYMINFLSIQTLTALDISEWRKDMTDESLLYLSALSNLRKLDLQDCGNITTTGILKSLSCLKRLNDLLINKKFFFDNDNNVFDLEYLCKHNLRISLN